MMRRFLARFRNAWHVLIDAEPSLWSFWSFNLHAPLYLPRFLRSFVRRMDSDGAFRQQVRAAWADPEATRYRDDLTRWWDRQYTLDHNVVGTIRPEIQEAENAIH